MDPVVTEGLLSRFVSPYKDPSREFFYPASYYFGNGRNEILHKRSVRAAHTRPEKNGTETQRCSPGSRVSLLIIPGYFMWVV